MLNEDSVFVIVVKDKEGKRKFRPFEDEQLAIEALAEMSKAKSSKVERMMSLSHTGITREVEIKMMDGRLVFSPVEMGIKRSQTESTFA